MRVSLYGQGYYWGQAKCLLYGITRWPHFRGFDCMQVYGDGVPDQAICQLFRGIRGFHCINGICKSRLQTTKFNSLLNFLAM